MRRIYGVFRVRRKMLAAVGILLLAVSILPGLPRPDRQAAAYRERLPIYSVNTAQKAMALGINCAWDNADIPLLIEILGTHNVTATFFVSGSWCKKFPQSVKALYDAGHEIASHSNTHADLTTLSKAEIQQEIRLCNEKIKAITGVVPTLFRAPSGAHSPLVVQTVLEEGLLPIQWDCDSLDYRDPTPQEICARIQSGMQPGSIALFHSGAKNTPAALPLVIEMARGQGYDVVSVSELVYPAPYALDHAGRQSKA
jgi:Predicted xylanase/chitin deacetylase